MILPHFMYWATLWLVLFALACVLTFWRQLSFFSGLVAVLLRLFSAHAW
jgi:hypothetical protein